MNIKIQPGKLSGAVTIPPSKSISHRALICAALSKGESEIRGLLECEDIDATRDALETLGAVLGRFALDAQLKAIDDCEEMLSGRLREYMSARKEENRLKLGLICAGCALILIVLA